MNAGTISVATGDDGVHADASITINGGDLEITRSYEGIESAIIILNGGNAHVVASDDGVNVSDGSGGGMMGGPGRGGRQGQGGVTSTSLYLTINGGTLTVDAGGDGLDSNGAIEMTGGVVVVHGPTEQMNGALDYNAWFNISGGWLVAAGSSGMAEAPSTSSAQASLLINFSSTQPAGTLVHIRSSEGTDLLTFAPSKAYQSILLSSGELTTGGSYPVSLGGSSNGVASDGVYSGGTYTGGVDYTTFKASGTVMSIGARGGFRR
ncbi:MAG: carbohydrate-binding domain-containing protein [Chloroflexi bacterium]|nr:carbohydrate-binding domain-containing protein [Chloroflexota bacterium]